MNLPSPTQSPQARWLFKKRAQARSAGLCSMCCKQHPDQGYAVCHTCKQRVHERRVRRRNFSLQHQVPKKHLNIAQDYEASGDHAVARNLYVEASAFFERALDYSRSAEDEVRLCEKIGEAFGNSMQPELATRWIERAVQKCDLIDNLQRKKINLTFRLAHHYWIEAKAADSMLQLEKAVMYADSFGDPTLIRFAKIFHTQLYYNLTEYSEEATSVAFSDEPVDSNDSRIAPFLFQLRADIYTLRGEAEAAFAAYDECIRRQEGRAEYLATVWSNYSTAALMLGRIDIARACRERVLLIAREQRIGWRIPSSILRFARLLLTLGEYDRAYALFLDALRYEVQTPVVYVSKVTVGIEIALVFGNNALLEEIIDERALEWAFRATQSEEVGPLTAACVKAFVVCNQFSRAKALVERGVASVLRPDLCGELLALAARYGSTETAQRARTLLVARMQLPHHRVAGAYLALWDTYAAVRRHASREANVHAKCAANLFEQLGWKHQQSEVLAVVGIKERNTLPPASMQTPLLANLASMLTRREQQVAELVVRGLSNRAIAQALNIREHTVEGHMTSILGRLGLRSRWQLIDKAE